MRKTRAGMPASRPSRHAMNGNAVSSTGKSGGIAPLDVDLAQGRDVDDADRVADVARLAIDRVEIALAGARIKLRPTPQPGIDELRARRLMPRIHRRAPQRIERRPDMMAGDR